MTRVVFVLLILAVPILGRFFLPNGYNITANTRVNIVRTCKVDGPETFVVNYGRYNKTMFTGSWNWTVLEPFGSLYDAHFEMYKLSDGGMKKYIDIKRHDACKAFYLIWGPVWEHIVEETNMNKGCPIQPGFYELKNSSHLNHLEAGLSPFLVWPGEFYLKVRTYKEQAVTTCVELQFEVYETFKY